MTPDPSRRPVIALLASSWISMLGVALATTAGFSWLFVIPMRVGSGMGNPYIGVLVVFAIPALLLLGLILIPVGMVRASHRVRAGLSTIPDRRAAWRKLIIFFGVMSFVNVLIGSQATYRAVKYMDTQSFCGQTCHVMKPEFTAWQRFPHSRVQCVECHIAPGTQGFIRAKMAGARQLVEVVANTYPRPIPPGLATNRLTRSADTCENCHSRDLDLGTPLLIKTRYKDDAANTRAVTVLTIKVGGATSGGIHGAHLRRGIHIRFASGDPKRQTIPLVEYTNAGGSRTTYVSSDAKAADILKMPVFEMQCVDCHNRPAHSFEPADQAVDDAISAGELPAALPYLKKQAVSLVSAAYRDSDHAAAAIPAGLSGFYRSSYPDVYIRNRARIEAAGATLSRIYSSNNFPDLKVAWGAYPSNLGHTDSPGCFRCHDGSHATSDSKSTINNDCTTCHQMPAVDETSPAILETLGIGGPVSQSEHP